MSTPDGLDSYNKELAIAKIALDPDDAELAYAYRDVARALHATGDFARARLHYETAITTLELAHRHIGSAFFKNEYLKTLKIVLQDHAFLLRQLGDTAAAEAAEKKRDAIVVKADVKDE